MPDDPRSDEDELAREIYETLGASAAAPAPAAVPRPAVNLKVKVSPEKQAEVQAWEALQGPNDVLPVVPGRQPMVPLRPPTTAAASDNEAFAAAAGAPPPAAPQPDQNIRNEIAQTLAEGQAQPSAPEAEMTIGEPSAIVTSGSGIARNIRAQPLKGEPDRDRANELATTAMRLGDRQTAQRVFDEWAAKGKPLAGDARAFPELPIPDSPFLAAPEADTLGRTVRDNAVAGGDAFLQGFGPKGVGLVEDTKGALGLEHDPWAARRLKERIQLAHQRSPWTTGATSMVAGALPWMAAGLPESPGALLAMGAGQGAVSGAGHSEAEDWSGFAEDVAKEAAQSAGMTLPFVIGAPLAQKALQATGSALERGAPAVRQKAGRANMRHALGRDFEAVAKERGGIEGIDELAEFARKEGLDKGALPQGVATFQKRARNVANEALQAHRNQATQAQQLGIDIDVEPIVSSLKAKQADLERKVGMSDKGLAAKYGEQAQRVEDLSPKVKREYYDAGLIDYPAKQEDFVWMSTPKLHPEQFAAGELKGVGGVSRSPGIGDFYPGTDAPTFDAKTGTMLDPAPNYLVEMPASVEGKPQATDIDYAGTREAGRKALAENMRAVQRVTEKTPEELAPQFYGDVMGEWAPEGTGPAEYARSLELAKRYGKPRVEAADSSEELQRALVRHFKERTAEARGQQDLGFARAEHAAHELPADAEALADVAAQKRAARVESLKGKVDPNQRALDLQEEFIRAHKIQDPEAKAKALARIAQERRELRAERMRLAQGPEQKAIELGEADIAARELPKTRSEVLADIARQKREANISRAEEDLGIGAVASSKFRDELESAVAQRVKKFANEQEAVPTRYDPSLGVKEGGSMLVSPSNTRFFTREGQAVPKIPGYTHGGVIPRAAEFNEAGNEARTAVNKAWPPVYGPFIEEVPGKISFPEALEQRIHLDDSVYKGKPSAEESQAARVADHTAALYRREMASALENEAPDLGTAWERNQKRLSDALTIEQPAARKFIRGEAQPGVDMPTIMGAQSMTGLMLALLRKARPDATMAKGLYGLESVMKDVGAGLRQAKPMRPASIAGELGAEFTAGGRSTLPAYAQAQKEAADDGRGHLSADGARKLLATNPAALGPYANQWRKALDSGDSAKVSALMQTLERDPIYNRYVKRLITDQTKTNR